MAAATASKSGTLRRRAHRPALLPLPSLADVCPIVVASHPSTPNTASSCPTLHLLPSLPPPLSRAALALAPPPLATASVMPAKVPLGVAKATPSLIPDRNQGASDGRQQRAGRTRMRSRSHGHGFSLGPAPPAPLHLWQGPGHATLPDAVTAASYSSSLAPPPPPTTYPYAGSVSLSASPTYGRTPHGFGSDEAWLSVQGAHASLSPGSACSSDSSTGSPQHSAFSYSSEHQVQATTLASHRSQDGRRDGTLLVVGRSALHRTAPVRPPASLHGVPEALPEALPSPSSVTAAVPSVRHGDTRGSDRSSASDRSRRLASAVSDASSMSVCSGIAEAPRRSFSSCREEELMDGDHGEDGNEDGKAQRAATAASAPYLLPRPAGALRARVQAALAQALARMQVPPATSAAGSWQEQLVN